MGNLFGKGITFSVRGALLFCGALGGLLAISQANVAAAEINDDGRKSPWTTGLGVGALFFETDEEFNSSFIVEAKTGYDFNKSLTLEGSFGYLPFVDARSDTKYNPDAWHLDETQAFRGALDLLYHLSDDTSVGSFRPYLAATGGVIYYSNTLADGGHFDPFAGAGVGVGYAMNRDWTARADYRLIVPVDDAEINHHSLLSLVYRWGCPEDAYAQAGSSQADEVQEMGDGVSSGGLQTVHFGFDDSTLSPEAQRKLRENAEWLKENRETRVSIQGHCDERGTNEYNMALGDRRANSAKDYLRSLGVENERLETVSYGEERPVDPRSTEEAWAKNRRVECIPQ